MIFSDSYNRNFKEDEQSGLMLLDEDILVSKFKGEIRDKITFLEDGDYQITPEIFVADAKAGQEYELPVDHNLVVDACSKLIACLLKTQSGYQGLKYWEVGSGQSSWSDSAPPSPVSGDVGLNNPLYRKAIQSTDMSFIDANSNVLASGISNRIQVVVTFGSTEANGYLREFGLFGGDSSCTSTLGTGIMINRKTHGVIYKTSGISLTRTLRLTF
jgi:hypothetical protein